MKKITILAFLVVFIIKLVSGFDLPPSPQYDPPVQPRGSFKGFFIQPRIKVEVGLKLTQEPVADLERNKKELEQTIQRKDKEISSLTAKLEQAEQELSDAYAQLNNIFS